MSEKRPIIRRRSHRSGEPFGAADEADFSDTRSSRAGGTDLLDLPLDGAEPADDADAWDRLGPGAPSADASADDRDGRDRDGRDPAPPSAPRSGRGSGSGRGWWLLVLLLGLPLAAGLGYLSRPLPPVLSVSTELVDFGQVRLGEALERTVRLSNGGEAPLVLDEVVLEGEGAGAFRWRDLDGCLGRELPPDELCGLQLEYAPTIDGRHQARLKLSTNAPDGQRGIPLLGEGTAPELRSGPAVVDFGGETVGYRGAQREIWLENRGAASLEVTSVGLGGLAAADFVRFADRCSGARLDPGSRCTTRFEFFPTDAGERRATLVVESDAAPLAEAPVLVGEGEAQQPLLTVEPNRLDFGELRVGRSGEPLSVTLGNGGNGPLEIGAVRLSVPKPEDDAFDDRPEKVVRSFPVEDLGCAGRRLEPGQTCELRLLFSPQLEEAMGALVEIEHSAGSAAHRLPLVGRGTAPHLRVHPARLSFGELPMGQKSPWQAVRLENVGTADLEVERVSMQGSDRRSFSSSAEGCTRAPIPPGQSCGVEIGFVARRDGPHRAELVLRHDADDGIDRVAVNGIGTRARLALEPARLDFGMVRVSQSRRLELRLRNTGRAPLRLGSIRLEGVSDGDLRLESSCAEQTLLPGRECRAAVRFSPSAVGARRGRLVIEHDAGEPREVPVEAAALPEPEPRLEVDPERVVFQDQRLGQRSPAEVVSLENTGNAPLELRDLAIEGSFLGEHLLLSKSCGRSLGPGERCTIRLAFEPRRTGERQAALVILHGGPGGTVRLLLLGRGVEEPGPGP